jgi:hypothetical protein
MVITTTFSIPPHVGMLVTRSAVSAMSHKAARSPSTGFNGEVLPSGPNGQHVAKTERFEATLDQINRPLWAIQVEFPGEARENHIEVGCATD